MLVRFQINKNHFIFLIYFFIELLKRINKNEYSIPKNTNNLLIYISHFFSFIFYLIEKRNSKNITKEKNLSFKHKETYSFKIIMLIIFCCILDLINYYPMEDFQLLKGIELISNQIQEFYMLILILLEKIFFKTKYYKHHYLSFFLFLIYPIYNFIKIYESNKNQYHILRFFLFYIYHCFFHYYPMAFVYIIYYHINRNYFVSIYLLSCIKGLLCIIGTIIIEIFIYYPNELSLFINTSKYNFAHYFHMFISLIYMILQNYLYILILLFFQPTFTGITLIYIPTIKTLLKFTKDFNIIELFFQFIFFFSITIYLEIIILSCFNLEYNVKIKIEERARLTIISEITDDEETETSIELNKTIC